MYVTTRTLGWHDLNETSTRTWTWARDDEPHVRAPASVDLAGNHHISTVAAWFALARCTRAIVAPLASRFSMSAARAAGVPLHGCCADVHTMISELTAANALQTSRDVSLATRLADERTRTRRAQRESSSSWRAAATVGYCAVTDSEAPGAACHADNAGDMQGWRPDKGSWRLPERVGVSWALAGAWCEEKCRACTRCRFISLSLRHADCSWFAKCDLTRLRTRVMGFLTRRVSLAVSVASGDHPTHPEIRILTSRSSASP